jgi:hypothetical protein
MRSVFAIAPLALVLAWLGPQPGQTARALSNLPEPWAQAQQAASNMGFRSSIQRGKEALLREASNRTPSGTPSVSLMEAAVVR